MTGKNITGQGILVCGCNGSGKSTLGKALAKRLGYHFIDNEDLFFPKTGGDYVYDSPRSKEEAKRLLAEEIRGHGRFVLAAVKGDYGSEILSACELAVVIRIPEDIRRQRVRDRSFQKFGERMLPGGDLYEREQRFFWMVEPRKAGDSEEWADSLGCVVIKVDWTKAIWENVEIIAGFLSGEGRAETGRDGGSSQGRQI